MKIEKTIKKITSYEMDGVTILSNNDSHKFTYDDDPNKFLEKYHKEIEKYYDGDEEAFSMDDFFADNWSEFVHFNCYYEDDDYDYDDLLKYIIDYYENHVLKDIIPH